MGMWFALHRGLVDGIGIDAIMGMSVWIVLSCGRVPLGNTAFAAIGALVTIDLAASHRWPVVLAALAGVLAAAASAYVLGFAVARLGAVPFAVATLAFGVLVSDDAVLGFGSGARLAPTSSTPLIWLLLVLVSIGAWRFMRSPGGRAFAAVSQDEDAARGAGLDPARARHLAFVAGGALAGLGGALIALHQGIVIAQSFAFEQNVAALAAVVIGGCASVAGPAIGAIVLAAFVIAAPGLVPYRAIFLPALLLVFVLALPGGLASIADRLVRRPAASAST